MIQLFLGGFRFVIRPTAPRKFPPKKHRTGGIERNRFKDSNDNQTNKIHSNQLNSDRIKPVKPAQR
jgi:hypothetical protein